MPLHARPEPDRPGGAYLEHANLNGAYPIGATWQQDAVPPRGSDRELDSGGPRRAEEARTAKVNRRATWQKTEQTRPEGAVSSVDLNWVALLASTQTSGRPRLVGVTPDAVKP